VSPREPRSPPPAPPPRPPPWGGAGRRAAARGARRGGGAHRGSLISWSSDMNWSTMSGLRAKTSGFGNAISRPIARAAKRRLVSATPRLPTFRPTASPTVAIRRPGRGAPDEREQAALPDKDLLERRGTRHPLAKVTPDCPDLDSPTLSRQYQTDSPALSRQYQTDSSTLSRQYQTDSSTLSRQYHPTQHSHVSTTQPNTLTSVPDTHCRVTFPAPRAGKRKSMSGDARSRPSLPY
jgi:hypothetical protein